MKTLSSALTCVGLWFCGINGLFAQEPLSPGRVPEALAAVRATPLSPADSAGAPAGQTPTLRAPAASQPIILPVPVHAPISWQTASSNGLARPAPPGGLHVVAASAPSEFSQYAGTWKREKAPAGELDTLVLNPEGTVTGSFVAERPQGKPALKGRWLALEQTIRLEFTSQVTGTRPSLRQTVVSVKQEGAGIVLVGEGGARFTRVAP